ncbi:MAG: hypothetical protein M3322_08620 [Actinomycetota bacterium]|nr:hypothetical protein [Actinomycetota bacterium]
MRNESAAERPGEPLGKAALAAAVLAALAFFVLGFAFEGWWFVIGLALAVVAVVLGVMARQRPISPSNLRLATIGLLIGGVIVAWFVVFVIVDAIV